MKSARLFSAFVIFLVMLAAFVSPVEAGKTYCSGDPVFDVGGREVNVLIELAPFELKDVISEDDPVRTLLWAPEGTDPEVVRIEGQFPEEAEAEEHDDDTLKIRVEVPDVEGFDSMRVTVYVDGQLMRRRVTHDRTVELELHWR